MSVSQNLWHLTIVYRTHRERKATYVKSLEDKVGELRKRNAEFQERLRQYHELLEQLGIPDPLHGVDATSSMRLATASLIGDTLETQKLEARLPEARTARCQPPVDLPVTNENHIDPECTGSSYSISDHASTANTSAHSPLPHDITQLGITFILALEKPCLHHQNIPCMSLAAVNNDEEPIDIDATGHVNMLSTPLIQRSPFSTIDDPLFSAYPSSAEWSVPAAELENLLSFSQKLGLRDGEITPVQVWQIITAHEKFGVLEVGDLERLRDALMPLVQCYG
jgi:hypothetical protein